MSIKTNLEDVLEETENSISKSAIKSKMDKKSPAKLDKNERDKKLKKKESSNQIDFVSVAR